MNSTTVANRDDGQRRNIQPATVESTGLLSGLSSTSAAGDFRFLPARAGDQPSTHHLLLSVFHRPSAAEFHAQNEEPLYEPSDRLLVKRGAQIVAHARLAKRQMHFGPVLLPVAALSELATLPEFRNQGIATALLRQAERQMVQEGAVLGVLRTPQPQFYLRRGWVVCGRHCYSTSGARDILSYMSEIEADRPQLLARKEKRLNIRLWRHVERAALARLYDENTRHASGAMRRSDDYWRWLISRRAYERIYVAIDGPNKLSLDDQMVPIVGYAVTKEGRIVEMMTSPKYPQAPAQMLSRACGDAIERDYHTVRIDAAPGDPLHEIVKSAGGMHRHHEVDNGDVFMAKVFDPLALIDRFLPHLQQRAKEASLPNPVELGLLYEGRKLCLELRRRSARLVSDRLPRKHLILGAAELTQMLLGHLDVPAAIEEGRLKASTRGAAALAATLLPQMPLWRPPLDDLAA